MLCRTDLSLVKVLFRFLTTSKIHIYPKKRKLPMGEVSEKHEIDFEFEIGNEDMTSTAFLNQEPVISLPSMFSSIH
jgi:hypothetical protein